MCVSVNASRSASTPSPFIDLDESIAGEQSHKTRLLY